MRAQALMLCGPINFGGKRRLKAFKCAQATWGMSMRAKTLASEQHKLDQELLKDSIHAGAGGRDRQGPGHAPAQPAGGQGVEVQPGTSSGGAGPGMEQGQVDTMVEREREANAAIKQLRMEWRDEHTRHEQQVLSSLPDPCSDLQWQETHSPTWI